MPTSHAAAPPTAALVALGFTELEAEVYLYLVEASPATAYAVAKGIERTVANTYKAVESLRQKGAVLVDETTDRSARLCRAVPGRELLRALESTFRRHQRAAAATIGQLKPARGDDAIYTLASVDQVIERCESMVHRAKDVVLVDAFPQALDRVGDALGRTAQRGVPVFVKAYAPVSVPGVDAVVSSEGSEVLERWPGQWLNVAADGLELLLSFTGPEGDLHQGLWSRSPYLSWTYHSALASEIGEAKLVNAVERGAPKAELRRVLAETQALRTAALRAYGNMRRRLGRRR